MGGHGALRAVAVAGNLREHGADGGAEHRLVHEVHDLRALGLGIVLEEHGGGTAAIDGTNALEQATCGGSRQAHGLHVGRQCGVHDNRQ